MRQWRSAAGLGTLIALLACSGNRGPKTEERDTGGECDGVRSKLKGLYRAERYDAPEGKEGEALRAELVSANVQMVLRDCATDPKRYVPCIVKAKSVSAIEADCIIPLDDFGSVEGAQFSEP